MAGLDLYACFPSSVEVARDSFAIATDDPRPLTLTGGLPYHGGPGSNYVTHSIANTARWLRAGHGDHALVHGNGYYLTKHSVGVYSRHAPPDAPEPSGADIVDESNRKQISADKNGSPTIWIWAAVCQPKLLTKRPRM